MPSIVDLRRGRSREAPRHATAAPPLGVPEAARLWLASSLALWGLVGLGVWNLLG